MGVGAGGAGAYSWSSACVLSLTVVDGSRSGGGVVGEAVGITVTGTGGTSRIGMATTFATTFGTTFAGTLAGDGVFAERAATFVVSVGFNRLLAAF